MRLRRNWSVEEALTTPLRSNIRRNIHEIGWRSNRGGEPSTLRCCNE
jgi:hypothetical protein